MDRWSLKDEHAQFWMLCLYLTVPPTLLLMELLKHVSFCAVACVKRGFNHKYDFSVPAVEMDNFVKKRRGVHISTQI